jgi:hypothetical protein
MYNRQRDLPKQPPLPSQKFMMQTEANEIILTFTTVNITAARGPSFGVDAIKSETKRTAPQAVSLMDQSGIAPRAASELVALKKSRLMYSLEKD